MKMKMKMKTMSDLIGRQDIKYHTQLEAMGNGQYEEVEIAYKDDIESLPSADRPTGWIPVSERLPKECDGHVLVSKEDGQVTTGLHSEFGNAWYIGDMCGVGGCKVIAWMPLPEPYKGGEE